MNSIITLFVAFFIGQSTFAEQEIFNSSDFVILANFSNSANATFEIYTVNREALQKSTDEMQARYGAVFQEIEQQGQRLAQEVPPDLFKLNESLNRYFRTKFEAEQSLSFNSDFLRTAKNEEVISVTYFDSQSQQLRTREISIKMTTAQESGKQWNELTLNSIKDGHVEYGVLLSNFPGETHHRLISREPGKGITTKLSYQCFELFY